MSDDFEKDLETLNSKIKEDLDFATDVYGALCNMRWKNINDSNIIYSCSWRYAGGMIADIRGNYHTMNYMDFYCSGNEGVVTEEIEKLFKELGWEQYPWED